LIAWIKNRKKSANDAIYRAAQGDHQMNISQKHHLSVSYLYLNECRKTKEDNGMMVMDETMVHSPCAGT
jgi:hypothetical protein